jgi:ubiquinone/menaquinone biosynthesis C-methylase UbiE
VSFDPIARYYRLLETFTFGSVLQKARSQWIERIAPPKRALVLGPGDGRLLCELLRVHGEARVDCVDASGRMLEIARQRLGKFPNHDINRVRFFQQDAVFWSPADFYDLFVLNFFLDCFPLSEIHSIIQKLARAATPSAHLFLADFAVPEKFVARIHAKLWLSIMYCFFRVTTDIPASELIDPTSVLEANGFVRLARSQWRLGLVKSELWHHA